jgi:MoxR-like ATPase
MPDLNDVTTQAKRVLDEVERVVVGKRDALELVLLGLLADGHVLIEDYPGLAKTVIARSFAKVLGLGFGRIQFTPDLMPADVTGSSIYDQRAGAFDFRPGPVFTNLLLADEINRTPPKTQAALLEAMQERQVTVEGVTRPLERPFLVVATQNPIEYEGTYPLPEAQLDRFLLRARIGYPARDDEWRILAHAWSGPATRPPWSRSSTRSACSRCRPPWSRSMWPRPSATTSSTWSRPPVTTPTSR